MPHQTHKQYRFFNYDYGGIGDYFITVCTKDRIPHFGKIIQTNKGALMELNEIGTFANESICSIPDKYKDATLGETIVMPNHIHLIITLPYKETVLQTEQSITQKTLSPAKGLAPLITSSISSIINHLKGNVTKWCRTNGYPNFTWQSRFHDHIIRDASSYNRISNYIANNVYNWQEDENNQNSNNFRKDIRS